MDINLVDPPLNNFIIDYSEKKLNEIPKWILNIIDIKILKLKNNFLTKIPNEIGNLKNLIYIDLAHNPLDNFPKALNSLNQLKGLGLAECFLDEIEEEIINLKYLEQLGLSKNYINHFPNYICDFNFLKKLDLSFNLIKTLPECIGNLKSLEWLNLSNNKLNKIPKSIGNLIKLKQLGLDNNQIKILPDLRNLELLEVLSAKGNQIEFIGYDICFMENISILNFDYNMITSLPPGIFMLPNIKKISLGFNKIKKLPTYPPSSWTSKNRLIKKRENFPELDLKNNLLRYIPIFYFINFEIFISGNPLNLNLKNFIKPFKKISIFDRFSNNWNYSNFLCYHCKENVKTLGTYFDSRKVGSFIGVDFPLSDLKLVPVKFFICNNCIIKL